MLLFSLIALCLMSKKKSIRCPSIIGRIGYSNKLISSNHILESTAPTTTILTPHVVKTTGTGMQQEPIIPIASLFSSMDLVQPSPKIKKSPSPRTFTRAKTSFYRTEQENDETTTT